MAGRELVDATDALLVGRASDGDIRAFEILLRRHANLMRAYARRLTGSGADADDVVQDAFITAWNSLDNIQDPAAAKAWLMRIVSRKSIDRIRARRQESDISDWDAPAGSRADPEHQAVVRSQLSAVAEVLTHLPEVQRQCWILKEVGGYSYQEIADELDVPAATVRGALARARQALLSGMEEWS
ncbi:RNA polymerase sigma factor [Humidisolicoccus flavus]|uniref:RNA polymerase sigma factor n=1 Tax=Humidisolicoccus flavus TaxID=3111414 RepID=UPI0032522D4B